MKPYHPVGCILRVVCILLLGSLAIAAVNMAEAAPSLGLSLNQPSFKAGESLRVGLTAQNPGSALRADFYLGILLPDGVTVLFLTGLSPLAGVGSRLDANPNTFQPLLANITLPQGLDVSLSEIFAFTFAGNEPAGTYVFFALFTSPGAFRDGRIDPGDILALDAKAFSFSPTGVRVIQVSGNNQVIAPGEVLPAPLVVRVEDQFGQPRAGVAATAQLVQGEAEFVSSPTPLALVPTTAALGTQASIGATRTEVTNARGEAAFFLRALPTSVGVLRTQVSALEQQVEFQTLVTFIKPVAIAVESNGNLVVADVFGVVRVNPSSGTRVLVSGSDPVTGLTIGGGLRFGQDRLAGIAVEGGGSLVVVGPDSVIDEFGGGFAAVVRVNPVTGDREVVSGDPADPGGRGTGPALLFPMGIAVEADGQLVVVDAFFGSGLKAVVRVDPRSGNRTIIASDTTGSGPSLCNARGIAVQGDGQLVVVGEFLDGTGSCPPEVGFTGVVRVDPRSGNRTALTTADTCRDVAGQSILHNPAGIAIEKNGRLVVLNKQFDSRAVVRIDPSSGSCTLVSRPPLGGLLSVGTGPDFLSPAGVAVEQDGNLVLVDDLLSAVVRVDPGTGNRHIVSPPARIGSGLLLLDPTGIAVEGTSNLIVLDSLFARVARVSPTTGDRTIVSGQDYETGLIIGGGRNFFGALKGVAVGTNGSLVVADGREDLAGIVQVNPNTGERTAISGCIDVDRTFQCSALRGSGPHLRRPEGIAVEGNGQLVIVDGVRDKGLGAVARVNPVTGDRTIVSGCTAVDTQERCVGAIIGRGPLFSDPAGIAVHSDGGLLVADGAVGVVRVDPVTGDRTIVSGVDPETRKLVGGGDPFVYLFGGIVIAGQGSVLVTDTTTTGAETDAAVVRVDLVTGERTFVSGRSKGTGPRLISPLRIAAEVDGKLVLVDGTLHAVVRVDPITGDRTVVSH